MKEYAIDWGSGKALAIAEEDKGRIVNYLVEPKSVTVLDFVREHSPCTIYIESSFESKRPERKAETIREADALGTEIFFVQPRSTMNHNREHGRQTDKTTSNSDLSDVLTIWDIAHQKGRHLRRATAQTRGDWKKRYEELFRGRLNTIYETGYKARDPEVARLLSYLPKAKDLATVDKRLPNALMNDKSYARTFVIPVLITSEYVVATGGDRGEFIRLMGIYEHGHPSILRAKFFRDRVSTLTKRALHASSLKGYRRELPDLTKAPEHKEAMKDLNFACRWLYQQVKNHPIAV